MNYDVEVPESVPANRTTSGEIDAATQALAEAGVASPRADAELLAAHVLGVRRSRLPLAGRFTADQLVTYRRLVVGRVARVPLQHLTGSAPFRELELAVGPGVFIPRPETELLVEWGLSVLPPGEATVVDLGAGSGAIALAVATERPNARVYAVERDPSALAWLRRNVSGHRVTVVEGDATDPATLSTLDGQVDLVLCNPPYVPDAVPVPPEVARDPREAVFAGPDGLAVIRPVIARAATLLRPGGWLGIEHDDSHGTTVPTLLAADGGFARITDHPDLAGRPRFTTARFEGVPGRKA